MHEAANEADFLHVMNDARNRGVDVLRAIPGVKECDRTDGFRRQFAQHARLAEPGVPANDDHPAQGQLANGDRFAAVDPRPPFREIAELRQIIETNRRDKIAPEWLKQAPSQRRNDQEQQGNESGADELAGPRVPEEHRLDGARPRKSDQEGRPKQRPADD